MRLFLCGDCMTGRGIDQILPSPCDPKLYEEHLDSAQDYVHLAELRSGPIPRAVPFDYIWGDALAEIDRRECDFRIANLETSITAGGDPEPKGINYRMHPQNIGCIQAVGIDCCVLANNHVADWGPRGLSDTLVTLASAGIEAVGAGLDAVEAARPAVFATGGGRRLLVFAFACQSSGVPASWAAVADGPGVNFLSGLDSPCADRVTASILEWRSPDDTVVVSIHWGKNWGHDVSIEHRRFAHQLIESGGADVIYGHSSHHPMGIEVSADKPILYGCGDFINDYEGIGGHDAFRPDLAMAYFIDIDDRDRRLTQLLMVPFRIRKFRLNWVEHADAIWLAGRMDRACLRFGHHVRLNGDRALTLTW